MDDEARSTMTTCRQALALGILCSAVLLAQPRPTLAAEMSAPTGTAEAVGSALLDKYAAAVNAHDTSAFGDIHTESYIQHSGRSPKGLPAPIQNFRGIFSSIPDVETCGEERVIAAHKVAALCV